MAARNAATQKQLTNARKQLANTQKELVAKTAEVAVLRDVVFNKQSSQPPLQFEPVPAAAYASSASSASPALSSSKPVPAAPTALTPVFDDNTPWSSDAFQDIKTEQEVVSRVRKNSGNQFDKSIPTEPCRHCTKGNCHFSMYPSTDIKLSNGTTKRVIHSLYKGGAQVALKQSVGFLQGREQVSKLLTPAPQLVSATADDFTSMYEANPNDPALLTLELERKELMKLSQPARDFYIVCAMGRLATNSKLQEGNLVVLAAAQDKFQDNVVNFAANAIKQFDANTGLRRLQGRGPRF